MPTESTSGLVSLIVAVSGHRDLSPEPEHLDAIRAHLSDFLLKQAHCYPNTPILLIAGMAEGADQLAVEVVRTLRHPQITWRPVLCMPEEIFLMDFTAEGRAIYQDQMRGQTAIRLPVHPGFTLDDLWQKNEAARAQQFRSLADFLVKASQILVAVWEATPGEPKAGGTAEVVARKRGQYIPQLSEETAFDDPFSSPSPLGVFPFGSGPVFHIAARRTTVQHHQPTLETNLLLPDETSRQDFEKIYLLMDEYNRDVATHPHLAGKAAAKARSLTGGELPVGATPAMVWCRDVRAWSAALSEHYQLMSKRLLRIIFVLVLFLGLSLHLIEPLAAAGMWPFYTMAAIVYCSCTLILVLLGAENGHLIWLTRRVHRWMRRKPESPLQMPRAGLKLRRKHEDYRALSEALRVQFFWLASGIAVMAGESYLNKHAGDMIWVREATSEAFLALYQQGAGTSDLVLFSNDLAECWLEKQFEYFDKTPGKLEPKRKFINATAWCLALPTFVLPMLLVLLSAYGPLAEHVRSLLGLAAPLLLLGAVVSWNYAETSGYEQTIQQARQMCRFYASARSRFKSLARELQVNTTPGSDVQATAIRQQMRHLLWRIGKDALAENGDWLAIHRGRDFKLNRTAG